VQVSGAAASAGTSYQGRVVAGVGSGAGIDAGLVERITGLVGKVSADQICDSC
jgi:hypothetical protein